MTRRSAVLFRDAIRRRIANELRANPSAAPWKYMDAWLEECHGRGADAWGVVVSGSVDIATVRKICPGLKRYHHALVHSQHLWE